MSKVGDKAISIPSVVSITIQGKKVLVKGKEGELVIDLPKELDAKQENNQLTIFKNDTNKETDVLHGLYRSLVNNAVIGVEKPWEKKLELVGTGFNVKLQGEDLVLKVGFSHQVVFPKQKGIKYQVEGNNKITLSGADKQYVGQVAFQLKKVKKPDAYKGKGIRYLGEQVRIKPGKKAKTATA